MKPQSVTRTQREVYRLGQPTSAEVEAFVAERWPGARHEGVGYWRIPRTAHIWYSGNNGDANGWYATLTYESMPKVRKS